MYHTEEADLELNLKEGMDINFANTLNSSNFNSAIDYPYVENGYSENQKVELISSHFEQILKILGLNLEDDSLTKTPRRYAEMLVKELFVGLQSENFPEIATQQNKFNYDQMLVETNIEIKSVCEHHFIPILGHCHIAYFPGEKVIGLSKLHRIAHFFARRPQVQERLTKQIKDCLSQLLQTDHVAVVVDALHLCVRMRGVQDSKAYTRTCDYGGKFLQSTIRQEFLTTIPQLKDLKI